MLDALAGINGEQRATSAPIICRNRSMSDSAEVRSRPDIGILAEADVGLLRVRFPDGSPVVKVSSSQLYPTLVNTHTSR